LDSHVITGSHVSRLETDNVWLIVSHVLTGIHVSRLETNKVWLIVGLTCVYRNSCQ